MKLKHQKSAVQTVYSAYKTEQGCRWHPCSVLVEARGVEPLSENPLIQLSTSVFCYLEFPSSDVNRQTSNSGSLLVRDRYKSKLSVHVHR